MAIVAGALWRRIDIPGHDACRLEQRENGWSIRGMAVFRHAAGPACIEYSMLCDQNWHALSGRVCGVVGKRQTESVIARTNGLWTLNGMVVAGLEEAVDLDFSFTPATNFPQLQRIAMAGEQGSSLPTAWFELDSGSLTNMPQTYIRRGERTFWYQAPSVGYAGLLEVAANGFISNYPNLWEAEELF